MPSELEKIGKEMIRQNNRATQFPLFIIMEDVKVYGLDPDWQDCESEENEEGDLVYYRMEEQPNLSAGVFFTAKACEDHIRANHYHYNNPRSYGISAWRNYEMQTVMLEIVARGLEKGEKIPSHYK